MKKQWTALLLSAALSAAMLTGAAAKTLYVDNQETDMIRPERLNMRVEPDKDATIVGIYYSGTEVESLDEMTAEYMKVSVGGLTGYMSRRYLIDALTASDRYRGNFGTGRAAEIDLSGMWTGAAPIYARNDSLSETLGTLANGAPVNLLGIVGGWAYITAESDGEKVTGYVPLDMLTDVGVYKRSVIAGSKADARIILYDVPTAKAKEKLSLKNGTTCFAVFGQTASGWQRVRVGGVSGWIKSGKAQELVGLANGERSAIPYYPLTMLTRGETQMNSEPDGSGQSATLGAGFKLEILAECGSMAYVRTFEGGAGASDCGDYGYVPLSMLTLAPSEQEGTGAARMTDDDKPVLLLDKPDEKAKLIGALCPGAEVAVTEFTQTDYVKVALGGMSGYVLKNAVTMTGEGKTFDRVAQRATLLEDAALWQKAKAGQTDNVLPAGSRVYMLGIVDGWAYVRAEGEKAVDPESGKEGFLPLSKLNAPAGAIYLSAKVNKDKINLRSRPSTEDGAIIGKARTDDRLRVAEYGNTWCCVVRENGTRGYVMTKYLDFDAGKP